MMYSLRNWCRQLFAARRPIRKPFRRNRLEVERLEDRVVLAYGVSISNTTDVTFNDTAANEQLWLKVDSGNLAYAVANVGGSPGAFTSTGVAASVVTSITINSATPAATPGTSPSVDILHLDDVTLTTTDFGSLSGGIVVKGSTGIVAVKTNTDPSALAVNYNYVGGVNTDTNVLSGAVVSTTQLAVIYDGINLGGVDDIIVGTTNHDNGVGVNPPPINGSSNADLILGLGGDDTINAGDGNDILIGGIGIDTLNGEGGDDTFVYRGTAEGYNNIDGGTGNNRIVAIGPGAVIGVNNLNNAPVVPNNGTIQKIEGHNTDTIVQSNPSTHSTLNLTDVELDGISLIEGGGTTANNNIYISTKSDATYRGNGGNDTFHLQGTKNATLLYPAADNGFDSFVIDGSYTGQAIAKATAVGVTIGIGDYNSQLTKIEGYSGGNTIVQGSADHDNPFNFANTELTDVTFVNSLAGNDVVTTSLSTNGNANITYDGGSYTGDQLLLAVTLDDVINHAAAIKADFDAAKANPTGPLLSNFFKFTVQNFESARLAVYNDGQLVGLIDNVILGTANHDNGNPAYKPALIGTTQNDLILGFGGDDLIDGGKGDDIIIGGIGQDTLKGGDGNDTFVYQGSNQGYDSLDGGTGTNSIVAVGAGTVIGVVHLNGAPNGWNPPILNTTIQKIVGSKTNDTIVRGSPSTHSVLNFADVELVNLPAPIEGGGTTTNDQIYVSTKTAASYVGGGGNDTFYLAGDKDVTLLYSGTGNGYDTYGATNYTGHAIAVAQTTGTVIGLGNYNGALDEIQGYSDGSTTIVASNSVHNILDFSTTTLTKIANVASGAGNDVVTTSLSTNGDVYNNGGPKIIYDGGDYTHDQLLLAITLDDAIDHAAAIAADLALARLHLDGSTVTLNNFFKFEVTGFEAAKLSVYNDGELLGLIDNIILGTSNHDAPGYAGTLNGTNLNDLILGFGGDDIINGLKGNDILIGGTGNDTLNGGDGDDTFVYRGDDGYYDTLDGGAGNNRIVAVGAGAVIGIANLNNASPVPDSGTIQKIQGYNGGSGDDTILRSSPSVHSTINLKDVELVNVKLVQGGGTTTNNSIYSSTESDADYKGGGGNDTFYLQGGKTVKLLYSKENNGFDTFIDSSFLDAANAIVEATEADVVIGIANYNNQVSEFRGYDDGSNTPSTIIRGSDGTHDTLDFTNTLLTNIKEINSGAGNDTVTTSLLNRAGSAGLTYNGGTDAYLLDKLRLTVTAAEYAANLAAINADLALIQNAITNNWSSGAVVLTNFFKFSVINFESVALVQIP